MLLLIDKESDFSICKKNDMEKYWLIYVLNNSLKQELYLLVQILENRDVPIFRFWKPKIGTVPIKSGWLVGMSIILLFL